MRWKKRGKKWTRVRGGKNPTSVGQGGGLGERGAVSCGACIRGRAGYAQRLGRLKKSSGKKKEAFGREATTPYEKLFSKKGGRFGCKFQ